LQSKSRPTPRAGGRAGALPRPKGFSPVERFLPSAFSCQIPRPPLTPAVGTPLAQQGKKTSHHIEREKS